MEQILRVLFLEDLDYDIELIRQKLISDFPQKIHLDSAGDEATYLRRLSESRYDIILADYTLPGFNAEGALQHRQRICPDVPFICVSGTIGEDIAVELLMQGATDYVIKDRLGRLSFAITRALQHSKAKKAQMEMEDELLETINLANDIADALSSANESNRLIMDSINEGIVIYDRDGTVLNINNAKAAGFGKTPKEFIGIKMTEYLPREKYGDLAEQRMEKLRKVFDSGINLVFEDTRDERWYLNRLYPIFKGPKITSVAMFTTDITCQKLADEEARKLADTEARLSMMTEFFTNISHEFKTPLAIILNSIEMIEMRLKNIEFQYKEKTFKYLSVMRQNSHRLLRLIANLLDITKIDAGYLRVYPQEIDISGWMEKLVESVGDFAAQKGIKVSLTDNCQIKTLAMDGDKLDRIMLNLLSNAIKHTGNGGHIRVSLTDNADKLLITVEDNGEGIPFDKQNLIFERFRQVDSSMTRASEGSGIGLALTKALVEMLQGRIWFISNPGEGTKFHLEFPVISCEGLEKLIIRDGFALNRKVEMEFSDIIL